MTVSSSQYLVSVADVLLRDATNDIVVLKGKTAVNSAFKQALSSQEVRGGFGAQLLFLYQHSKKLDVDIELASFDESVFALNNGSSILGAQTQNYYFEEVLTANGSGVVTTTNAIVTGTNAYVQPVAGGVTQTIVPTTSNTVTISGGANNQYRVGYRYAATVDSIALAASGIPNAYELTMISKVFSGSSQIAEMVITIPQYRLTGSFDLSFSATGVSSTKISGTSLVDPASGNYATVQIRYLSGGTAPFIAIGATPGAVSLSSSNTTSQLTVYGIRGGLYGTSTIPAASCTFTSSATGTCTVSAGGLLTRVSAGSANITITTVSNGQTLTDVVPVVCT